ncbi:MAG: glycosyltransferase family 2 protein [Anaerolineae bacterium]|jgi:dolichyl-phosphate beta-glucosyltransferase|nr:glycosyltransferase family 2 protein [Anaerolineae bacterium]
MNNDEPLMTIVIPAYNEAQRLPDTLNRVVAFVQSCSEALEVIVVNNNSRDMTREAACQFAERYPFLHVIDQPIQGKGAAVRKGIMEARGRYAFICDADLAMPIEELPRFFPVSLKGDYDIAIGSREAPGSHRYNEPAYRHLMGRVFNFVVRSLAVPGINDTQCGFKAFRREVARDLFTVQKIDGFAFDVEVLAIALRRGYKILEVGIPWYYGKGSTVNPIQDSIRMVREVLHIRHNVRSGVYDQP